LRIIFLSTFEKWQKSFAEKFFVLPDSGGMLCTARLAVNAPDSTNKIR